MLHSIMPFVKGSLTATAVALSCWAANLVAAETVASMYDVGIARVDVTPETPIRMSGYGSRSTESQGVEQPLFAKALAIRATGAAEAAAPLVLVTVDVIGVPESMTQAVAARLATKYRLPRENLAICASHTHTGPMIGSVAKLILTGNPPPEELARIEANIVRLTQKLGDVAEAALADMKPSELKHAIGQVDFAINRRLLKDGQWAGFGSVPEGAVDRTLPTLFIYEAGKGGKLRGVLVNYACHCTTLGPKMMKLHGDWAGCFQEQWEREHPGTTALVSIGCGGDANPEPRSDDLAQVRAHGDAMVREVKRLLKENQSRLTGPTSARREEFTLPLGDPPTRAEFEERLKGKGPIVAHAKLNLERLDRGEKLPTTVPYSTQAWIFGNSLAMVFLPGEVVVDYQLRLNRELLKGRLWVNAYSNDSPCYIASARMIPEGGYEVDSSMYYYDKPQRLRPEAEDVLIAGVHRVVPSQFDMARRYDHDIAMIEARDRETPPPTGGILFIGSSTIRLWKLDRYYSDLPVVNHGFGGAMISDSVFFFDRLVLPVKPRQIVLYAGGNDVNAGKTPEQVAADFGRFAELVRKHLPETRLTYVGIGPNVLRWHLIEKTRAVNRLIAAQIAKLDPARTEYVEIEDKLLDSAGQPQPNLYLPDRLHLNDAGYDILSRIVRPHLR
jgi:hypothetical protein